MSTPIEKVLEPGFELSLYRAAVANLQDKANPLRLSNYAYAVRELSRHILHRLAPDAEVRRCCWFHEEKPGLITRTQRAQYAIQGGLSEEYVQNTLDIDVEATKKTLADAVRNLNRFTHIEEQGFNLPPATVDLHVQETEAALEALCATILECRAELLDKLSDQIDDAIIDRSIEETIHSVDELATHHTIDEVHTEEVKVVSIDAERITLKANGTVNVALQWGSRSDRANDMGAEIPMSFPFTCNLSSPVNEPSEVHSDDDTLLVDTSSWRGGEDDHL